MEPTAVRFTVLGCPDVPLVHAVTVAGGHLAAAQVSGAPKATVEVLERPWERAPNLVHVVRF